MAKKTRTRKAVQRRVGSAPKRRAAKRRAPAKADPIDTLVSASAAALDLPLDPAWHEAVKENLALALRFAANVAAFELPDEAEPAPVFRA